MKNTCLFLVHPLFVFIVFSVVGGVQSARVSKNSMSTVYEGTSLFFNVNSQLMRMSGFNFDVIIVISIVFHDAIGSPRFSMAQRC